MTTSYGGVPPGITGTHYGGASIGVLGSLVPSTGLSGAGYLYAGLSLPADDSKEVRGPITRWPTNGTLTVYEDSSFTYAGTTDYALYALYVDGVASTTDIGYGAGIGRLDLVVGGPVVVPYVVTEPFKDWAGTLLPLATIPGVLVVNPSTRAVLLSLADQVTQADARLRLEDAALPTGQPVVVVSFNADGSARGVDTYTVQ